MSDLNIKILELIRENKSINEIQEILKIGPKKLMIQLRTIASEGYFINKQINSDGNIILKLKTDFVRQKFNINLDDKEELRVIFISDLHLGRKKDRLDYLDAVYNYAIKNNIGIIINLGDVVENVYHLPESQLAMKTIEEQIDYVIKNYPFDKNISNIILYGNHDLYSLTNYGLNIGKVIENNRYDLLALAYNQGSIFMKNDTIFLSHGGNIDYSKNQKIIFNGHSHKMMNNILCDKIVIDVPALSDAVPSNYDYNPLKGFLDVNFEFNKDMISKVFIKHQIMHYGIHQASETKIKVKK